MFIIEEVRRNDESKSWNPVFQKINIETHKRTQDLTLNAAKLPENRNFNRYRDVLPYDHTRVVLNETGESKGYINANFVEVDGVGHKYILTQGPLPNTCEHFWQMIWEQNTTSIIMLNKVLEKNAIKCHPYWPMGESEVVQFGPYSITNESETMKSSYIVRDFILKNEKLGESRYIKHFHYVMWPDFGVPDDPESFLRFLYEIRKSDAFDSSTGCPVVHCSAGIGRSGTFCLVDSALTKVQKENKVDDLSITNMLIELRTQRVGLIQTPDQLRFSHLAIIYGVHQLLPESFEDLTEEDVKENGESEEDSEPPPLPPRPKRNDTLPSHGVKREGEQAVADENQRQKKMYKELNNLEDSSDGSEEDELIDLDASDIDLGLDDTENVSTDSEQSPTEKPLPPLPNDSDTIQNKDTEPSLPEINTKIIVTQSSQDNEPAGSGSNILKDKADVTVPETLRNDKDTNVIPGPSETDKPKIGRKASDPQAQEHRKRRLEKKEHTAEIVNNIKKKIIEKEYHTANQKMWIKSAIAVGVCVGLFACYKIIF